MYMSQRQLISIEIDLAQRDAIKAIQKRDGINQSEQIRRGIALWLAQKEREHTIIKKAKAS